MMEKTQRHVLIKFESLALGLAPLAKRNWTCRTTKQLQWHAQQDAHTVRT